VRRLALLALWEASNPRLTEALNLLGSCDRFVLTNDWC
jgi:hypothetical protein